MSKENKEQDRIIKDAQYRKGLSIAFFNATNGAIEMVKLEGMGTNLLKEDSKLNPLEIRIQLWRNWLLEEHKKYYAEVIANIGVNYRAEESIAKLQEAKTLEDLNTVWRLFSADERRDGEIIKVAQDLKKKLQNEKA